MRFRGLRFHPALIPGLAVVLLLPLFLWLGVWQLERAAFKRELLAELEESETQPVLMVDKLLNSVSELRFRKVRVKGYFETDNQVYIDNRKHQNRIGYHIITPLRLENSDVRVLVNRGWVAKPKQNSLPVTETPLGLVAVRGTIDIPAAPALVLDDAVPDSNTRAVWPYLTIERFAVGADYPVQPFIILQSSEDPNGFVRSWPKRLPNDAMHIGYAIQWFAFALITLIIFVRLSLAPDENKQGEETE